MNSFYNGPHGECSEQMYKLWQLLKAKGITMYNGFPNGWFFFEVNGVRYEVTDSEMGLRMVWTKRYDQKIAVQAPGFSRGVKPLKDSIQVGVI